MSSSSYDYHNQSERIWKTYVALEESSRNSSRRDNHEIIHQNDQTSHHNHYMMMSRGSMEYPGGGGTQSSSEIGEPFPEAMQHAMTYLLCISVSLYIFSKVMQPHLIMSLAPQFLTDNTVILNIYDIAPINAVIGALGIGVYHTGIQVHGMEVSFGRALTGSGVGTMEPRMYPHHTFRGCLVLGKTQYTRDAFCALLETTSEKWRAQDYHIMRKNCNHFTQEFSQLLMGCSRGVVLREYPQWVNRLSRVGVAVLPTSLVERIEETDVEMFHDAMALSQYESVSSG
eukprot:PhF_6_TR11318/c0_g1_i1/m.18271